MNTFPPFTLSEEHREEALARVMQSGGTRPEGEVMLDLMVHAINEALAKFEEVCDRNPRPSYALMARLNGIGWLAGYAKKLEAAVKEVAPTIPGAVIHRTE